MGCFYVRLALIPDDTSEGKLSQWGYHGVVERRRAINKVSAAGTFRAFASNGHMQSFAKGDDVFAHLQLIAFAFREVRQAVLGNQMDNNIVLSCTQQARPTKCPLTKMLSASFMAPKRSRAG